MILPPATIGMMGGGQLGRMFTTAAAHMGYKVVVYCEDPSEPAAQVSYRTVIGKLDDEVAVADFAKQCDVITLEFENISAATIAKCSEFAPTFPSAAVLAVAQDRLLEKSTLRAAGLPVTPFAEVSDPESLCSVADELGWPLIVKTARSGYDGKGQYRVENAEEAKSVPWDSFDSWIAEQCISFDCEVSVIVARTVSGDSKCFPVFLNEHQSHILDITTIPAALSDDLCAKAREVATAATESLDVVGLLCVEFFVVNGDSVIINEVAPRPHNSGHVTIEALHTSQFEQHVRAVCGLPLGDTGLVSGGAAMANLMGDLWNEDGSPPSWNDIMSLPDMHLHLYGKKAAKPGRKMGHLTVRGDSAEDARAKVASARDLLRRV